jgi:hypothetical protein
VLGWELGYPILDKTSKLAEILVWDPVVVLFVYYCTPTWDPGNLGFVVGSGVYVWSDGRIGKKDIREG